MQVTCLIQTPTPNLQTSWAFYRQIGFRPIDESNLVWTDGKAHIEINPDRYARAGVKIFKHDWQREVDLLKKVTNVVTIDNGFVLGDASGTWIYLIENTPPIQDSVQMEGFARLGNFQGLSLESIDIEKSIFIFGNLGFKHAGGSLDHGYVVYTMGDFAISLMKPLSCPHLFFNPSLNYFNGKENLNIISNIREHGIPITEEISIFNPHGLVDNVIIRDPGGLGFFIFSD